MVAVTGFDEQYTVDNLNRLRDMKRGTLNGSHVIPGTPPRQLAWTLDPTGNWTVYSERTSGSTTLLQTRTASEVNEITDITSFLSPTWATPAYDDAGNMTSFPRASSPAGSFTAIYDAWNRLMSVKQGANSVAAYEYDGLRRRVVKKSYVAGVLTETRDYYFSDQWQVLAEAVGGTTDTTYVWGLRYVDELLWRVQSSTRLYAMQDANYNCTAIGDTTGSVVERYQFNPYGTRTILDASWSVIGVSGYNWVLAHQGLAIDPTTSLYPCRNRTFASLLGMWMQRDPAGYIDSKSLYEYARGNPATYNDALGLSSSADNPKGGCSSSSASSPKSYNIKFGSNCPQWVIDAFNDPEITSMLPLLDLHCSKYRALYYPHCTAPIYSPLVEIECSDCTEYHEATGGQIKLCMPMLSPAGVVEVLRHEMTHTIQICGVTSFHTRMGASTYFCLQAELQAYCNQSPANRRLCGRWDAYAQNTMCGQACQSCGHGIFATYESCMEKCKKHLKETPRGWPCSWNDFIPNAAFALFARPEEGE